MRRTFRRSAFSCLMITHVHRTWTGSLSQWYVHAHANTRASLASAAPRVYHRRRRFSPIGDRLCRRLRIRAPERPRRNRRTCYSFSPTISDSTPSTHSPTNSLAQNSCRRRTSTRSSAAGRRLRTRTFPAAPARRSACRAAPCFTVVGRCFTSTASARPFRMSTSPSANVFGALGTRRLVQGNGTTARPRSIAVSRTATRSSSVV